MSPAAKWAPRSAERGSTRPVEVQRRKDVISTDFLLMMPSSEKLQTAYNFLHIYKLIRVYFYQFSLFLIHGCYHLTCVMTPGLICMGWIGGA